MKELLLGCGSRTKKDLSVVGHETFENVVRLDVNTDHKPDIVHDLTIHPLPFLDNEFDEIHAYDVLEHLAYQGDFKFFFREFSEYWRILKPDGLMFITVPSARSVWAWGDPSHKRIISLENTVFLNQDEYKKQIGVTRMSDFRNIYNGNFKLVFQKDDNETLAIILEAKKCKS